MASSIAIPPPEAASSLDWRKMNKQQLRDALASRGLDTEGLRPLLIQRLESSSKASESAANANPIADADNANAIADTNANAAVEGISEQQEEEEETKPPSPQEEKQESPESEALGIEPKAKIEKAASGSPLKASPLTQDATEKQDLNGVNGSTGSLSDFEKKQRRAERFGLELQVSEEEKRRIRAARFGVAQGMNKATGDKGTEIEKRKQRAMRFGIADDDSRKKAREDGSVESEKRKARAERFGAATEDSEVKANKN